MIIATNARPPTPLWSLGTCPAPGGTALAGEYESPAIPDLDALVEAEPFVREYLARVGASG